MIQQDARRILELDQTIKALEVKRAEVAERSTIAKLLRFITEYEPIGTSDLAGEIGTIERFRKEGSLAQYRGMATLDNSSGEHQGSKQPKHVNTRANALAETVFDALVRYLTTNDL